MKKLIDHKIFRLFVVWRLWLFIPVFFASQFIAFRENSLFTTIWQYTDPYQVVKNDAIYPWSNFDGVHYLAIASRGYITEGRFLPLYPALIRALSSPAELFGGLTPFGGWVFWSGLFLSNVFFLLSLIYLKKLIELDYSEKLSQKVITLLLAFPTSFFLVAVYTESLFLLLSVLVIFFSRKKEWTKAILFAMLLSITRLPGILILIPMVYEFLISELGLKPSKLESWKKILFIHWKKFLHGSIKFLLIPIPLIVYSLFNYYKWSDPLFFVNNHASLGNSREVTSVVFPLVIIYRYIKIFLTVSFKQYEFWTAVIEFGSLAIAVFGLVFAFMKKIRTSYLLFAAALITLPLFSGTLTGFPRYLLISFPIFIALVEVLKSKSKFLWSLLIFSSLMLQSLLLMLFSRGWFVA